MHNMAMREALTSACQAAGHKVVTHKAKVKPIPPIVRPLPSPARTHKKALTYRELRDCYVFRQRDKEGLSRIYTKVTDACAIDERTGKDACFAGLDRVEPLYPACCDLI